MTKFLAVAPLQGHPDAANIFTAVGNVFGSTDGASTLLSTLQGVAAKAIAEFNPKV